MSQLPSTSTPDQRERISHEQIARLIVACVLSFILWVFVSYTTNPDQRTQFENIPVAIEGLDERHIIVDDEGLPRTSRAQVNIVVDAAADTLGRLRASDLRAYVDVSDLAPGEHQVPVNIVTTRSGLTQVRPIAEPAFLVVRIDQEIARAIPVAVELSGAVPFGFEAGAPRLTVLNDDLSRVIVRGPQGRVVRVTRARVGADISGLAADYDSSRPIEALDSDGQVVAGVTIEPASGNLLVPIRSSVGIKRVPIVPKLSGIPAAGFVVSSVAVEPPLVSITGSSGPLDAISDVTTFEVDVTGTTATFSQTVALAEPFTARIGFGEPREALVTVEVTPIERTFQVALPLAVRLTGIPDGTTVSVVPPIIEVRLSGDATALGRITSGTLSAAVDATALPIGSTSVRPTIRLPQGVSLADAVAEVTVIVRAPLPTPDATATPEPVPDVTATPEPAPDVTATPIP